MRRVRLVIADRRPIVLQGLVSLLGAQPDFEVVACCLNGAGCLAAIRSLTPDVVLLEDAFTDVTASDILAAVDDEGLSSRLVFFTATVTCGDIARALATGACGAIPTNAKPEALVQSLRLEKPGSDLARVGDGANGTASFGNNVLAVLTVNELTIMDFVAEGLSDSEIARVLGVSLEIVKMHVDHARQKLGINSRTEFAALARSRRYGAMSVLIAAILAALDDSPGHAATEGFSVMAANGGVEVVTIKIGRKEVVSGGIPAKSASKDRAGAVTLTSSPTGKLVDPGAEIAPSLSSQAALNASRPGSGCYSIFTVAAFAALIYELDGANHAVQAFDFRDEIVTSSAASDANGLASPLPSFANFGGAVVYDAAFEFARSDTIARDGSELYVGAAHAEKGGSDREVNIPQGSGTVDVAAAANEPSQRDPVQTDRDSESNQDRSQSNLRASDKSSEATKHEASVDGLDHGQSQKALHESDNSSVIPKEHAKQEAAEDGPNHGQPQKALHESENGSVFAEGDDNHEAPKEDSNRGQTDGALQTFGDGAAAGKQQAQHPPAKDSDTGKSQQDISSASLNSANSAHSANIETAGKDAPSHGNADQAKSGVGTGLGDSFHFKNGADNTSSDMYVLQQLSHGNGRDGDGQHAVAREAPEQFPVANWIDISDAHHDHSVHANLHAVHDLIV